MIGGPGTPALACRALSILVQPAPCARRAGTGPGQAVRNETLQAGEHGPPAGSGRLAPPLRAAAVILLGFVLAYRPLVSGMVYALAPSATFGALLLTAGLLWLLSELVDGRLRVRIGLPGGLFVAFMAAGLASALRSPHRAAGLEWCLAFGTYGLTGFLVVQLADGRAERRFLLGCVLATGAALAVYGIYHRAFYVPALLRWYEQDPAGFMAVLGAESSLAGAVASRVGGTRAYGSFVTANQFAGFLALTLLPLLGFLLAVRRRAARTALGAALLAGVTALWLARSRGGTAAFAFGLVTFALLSGCGRVGRLRRWICIAVTVLAVAGVVGLASGLLRPPASLRVRLDYWRVSSRIALAHPALGAGPGTWADRYTALKEPEYEETRSAHSAYLHVWAENGTVGLTLLLACCAALLLNIMRGRSRSGEGPADAADGRWLIRAGLIAAAVAWAFHAAVLRGFHPPQHGMPAWPAAQWAWPYLLSYAAWAATFVALNARTGKGGMRLPACGVLAGLAAFLLHSAAEFTLRVPAIGASAVALAVLLAMEASPSRRRHLNLGVAASAALMLACAAAVTLWTVLIVGRVLDGSIARTEADAARTALARRDLAPADASATAGQVTDHLRRACRAVPWDDEARRRLGDWLLWLAGPDDAAADEALSAAERAVAINPLAAANWRLLGDARTHKGDLAGAATAYARARDRHPSLPLAWLTWAAAAERAGQERAVVCAGYERALELLPRQYHRRNRIPGPPRALTAFWRMATGAPADAPLLDVAVDLARRRGVSIPADAAGSEKVRLALGDLPGARALADAWDGLGAPERDKRLWRLAAERLWLWAVEENLARCTGGS